MMFTKKTRKLISVIFCASILAACGGGGGGGSGGNSGIPTRPQAAPPAGYDLTQGTPSTYADAFSGIQTHIFTHFENSIRSDERATLRALTSDNFLTALSPNVLIAMRDTNAQRAWQQGWTGKDVKVGHLDDFLTKDISFTLDPTDALSPTTQRSHGELTRLVTFQIAPEITHTSQQITLTCGASNQDQQQRTAYQFMSDNGYHIVNNSFGSNRYDNGGCSGTPRLASLPDWQASIDSYINDQVFLNIATTSIATSYDAEMLFVFAAGNERQGCAFNTDGCNLYAASLKKRRDDGETNAGERVMFVGALEDDSTRLADYSHAAGEVQNDYIVAHDDVVYRGDFGGTSFAAPRVVGAAALVRHKFPNLDGPQLKQVLLQTADDLGAAGVDNIYGHGKLNVLNALSPIGRVTAR